MHTINDPVVGGFRRLATGTSETNVRTAVISGNGRFVAFDSYSAGLVPNDSDQRPDVFVHEVAGD